MNDKISKIREKIPDFVCQTADILVQNGYEAFIVGGCVRDLFLGVEPKDWDITTNARPEQMLDILPDSRYENNFGTVLMPVRDGAENVLGVLEITTYRSEQGYSDRRHPDEIRFEDDIESDLARRDFTVNAMALRLDDWQAGDEYELIDLFGGKKDIDKKVVRAVGEPADRFREDALRMMRAIRFSAQLGFSIEPKTERAIVKLAGSIKFIANERIRDEFVKILSSDRFYEGVVDLYNTKLLQYILPELTTSEGVAQNKHHTYDVFKHSMLSLKFCPSKDWQVRLASLLHDIGKPRAKRMQDGDATFYNHEMVGAKMVAKIVDRLKFSRQDGDRIVNLVRNHMFYYNVDEVTAASVRRLIVKVGEENLKDLIDLRIADRLGSGVAKAKPYKLRHLEYMFDRVRQDPVSVKMLKVNGDTLMQDLGIKPGPIIGAILDVLLSEVIEDPGLNTAPYLLSRAKELKVLDIEELRNQAKARIEEKRQDDDNKMKKGFYVK